MGPGSFNTWLLWKVTHKFHHFNAPTLIYIYIFFFQSSNYYFSLGEPFTSRCLFTLSAWRRFVLLGPVSCLITFCLTNYFLFFSSPSLLCPVIVSFFCPVFSFLWSLLLFFLSLYLTLPDLLSLVSSFPCMVLSSFPCFFFVLLFCIVLLHVTLGPLVGPLVSFTLIGQNGYLPIKYLVSRASFQTISIFNKSSFKDSVLGL